MFSALIDSFLDLLAPLGGVEAVRMFGGHGFKKDGLMFALEAYGRLFIKTDDVNRAVFSDAGCEPFTYRNKDRKAIVSYFEPPESAFINPQKMKPWAVLGWEAAQRAFQKRPASKKKTKLPRAKVAAKPAAKRGWRKGSKK
jgi:DNA transformation protein